MLDHFSGSAISRRDFLKTVLLAGGALLLPGGFGSLMPDAQAKPIPPPFWWMSLRDNILHGPSHCHCAFGMPGSLMKLVAASALLEERLITPDTLLECRGTVVVHGKKFSCRHAHGKLKIREALGVSCSGFFASASEVLSTHRFLRYAEAFGLNHPTQKGEGYLYPNHSAYDHPSLLYVQGLSRTMQPNTRQLIRLVRHIARRDIPGFHAQTWDILQSGMRISATRGSASKIDPGNRLRVAAKTGTAPHGGTYQSWVIGYFPFEKPEYIFCTRTVAGAAPDTAIPQARRFLSTREWG